MNKETAAGCFELAITVENYMEAFYTALAEKFLHVMPVADFWRRMAEQEKMHALQLQVIRDSLSEAELRSPLAFTESDAYYDLILAQPVAERVAKVQNLEEAFALAASLETPETNALFSFLIRNFARNPQVEELLLEALRQHIEQLADFARYFGVGENRKKIKSR